MPYEVKVQGDRKEIIEWLNMNVGKCSFIANTFYYSAKGVGWEILPYGVDYGRSAFEVPEKYVIRIWDKDKAFLTRLRWE